MNHKPTEGEDRCEWCGQPPHVVGETKVPLWLSDSGELFHKLCHEVLSKRFELLGIRGTSKLIREWK